MRRAGWIIICHQRWFPLISGRSQFEHGVPQLKVDGCFKNDIQGHYLSNIQLWKQHLNVNKVSKCGANHCQWHGPRSPSNYRSDLWVCLSVLSTHGFFCVQPPRCAVFVFALVFVLALQRFPLVQNWSSCWAWARRRPYEAVIALINPRSHTT